MLPGPMEALARTLHVLVPVAWTAAATTYLFVFLRDDEGAGRWAPRLAWAAALLHLAELSVGAALGATPLVQAGAVVAGMGLAAALVYLALERRIGKRTTGVFAIGPAAVLATVGATWGNPLEPPPGGFPPASTALHVGGAMLGYGGLLLAATFGGLYLVQRRALKGRAFGLVFDRLPSLELLDQYSAGSLAAGTIFLTATIAFGHVVRKSADVGGTYWDAKVIATNLLWLLAFAVVVLRRARRLQAPGAARACLGLFLFALGNMFVVDHFSRVHKGV
jgi:ABC-type uncharacterized transport system permease subunit